MALHSLFVILSQWLPTSSLSHQVKKRPAEIKIRISLLPERPKAQSAAAIAQAAKGPPNAAPRVTKAPINKTLPPQPRRETKKIDRYEDLLPGPNWQEGSRETEFDAENDAGRSGVDSGNRHTIPQDLAAAAEEFSGRFDIPLVFREGHPDAKAVAKLVQRVDHSFFFETLDGDPLLRAVLFDAICGAKGRQQMLELFRRLRSSEVMVILTQAVVQGNEPTAWTEESFRINGHKLLIKKVTRLGMMAKGTIPEEAWRRARRRDAGELSRLEMSPAFQAPLRNRDLQR